MLAFKNINKLRVQGDAGKMENVEVILHVRRRAALMFYPEAPSQLELTISVNTMFKRSFCLRLMVAKSCSAF